MRDRVRFDSGLADVQLGDPLALVKAAAGDEKRVAGAHSKTSRQLALDASVELPFPPLLRSDSLFAGKRLQRPDGNLGETLAVLGQLASVTTE